MRPDILLLTINGKPAPWGSILSGRIMDFSLDDNPGLEADSISIELSDHDGRLAIPDKDAEIGATLAGVDKGLYTVDQITHRGSPDRLIIRASSAEFRGKFGEKRTESYDDTTLGAIIETIAGRHGWESRISDQLKDKAIPHLDQTEESDAHLLTRLAERYDALGTVKKQTLLFLKAGEPVTASGQPLPTTIITRRDGDGHSWRRDDRTGRHTGVKAFWQSAKGSDRQSIEIGEEGYRKQLRHTYASEAEAQAAAEAEWARLQRGKASFSLSLASGIATLMPHAPIELRGWNSTITQEQWITRQTSHQVSPDGGFTSSVALELIIKDR